MESKEHVFGCGCKFKIVGTHPINPKYPLIDWDIVNTPYTCKETWKLISTGRTKGIFQLESQLGQQWAAKIAPETIEDMGAMGALLRPGCLRSISDGKSMTQHYADRKNGREEVSEYQVNIDKVLSTTYGVLTYQEQAMRLCIEIAKFNEQEADALRKAIGKKLAQEMAAVKRNFIEKAKSDGIVTHAQAEEVFGWIEKSQRYSFNKSHAVCYGITGYWCAYAKYHFTKAFFASWLRNSYSDQKPKEEVAALVSDAKMFSINVKCPDFRDGKNNFYISGGDIRTGLGNIKGVGEAVIEKIKLKTQIVENMLGKQRSSWEWLDALFAFSQYVSSTAFTAMINSGAFDYAKISRSKMCYEYDKWEQLNDGEKDWFISNHINKKWKTFEEALDDGAKLKADGGAAKSKRGLEKILNIITSLKNPPIDLKDNPDIIASKEEVLIGCPLSYNRIDNCDTSGANCTCKEFVNGKHTDVICIAAELTDVRTNIIKNGDNKGKKMAFLKVYDGTCSMDNVLVFSEAYNEFGNLLVSKNTVLLDGYKSKDGAFIVKKVTQI